MDNFLLQEKDVLNAPKCQLVFERKIKGVRVCLVKGYKNYIVTIDGKNIEGYCVELYKGHDHIQAMRDYNNYTPPAKHNFFNDVILFKDPECLTYSVLFYILALGAISAIYIGLTQ